MIVAKKGTIMRLGVFRKRCTNFRIVGQSALFFAMAEGSWAIAPQFVSDEELAAYPIVVVGKWEKGPFKANHRYEDRGEQKVITAIESFTALNVLRVIKGDVKPGVHMLKRGWGIAWAADGGWVTSGTSTELLGDVKNVTQPNIWFLQKARSWDESDKTEYLSVSIPTTRVLASGDKEKVGSTYDRRQIPFRRARERKLSELPNKTERSARALARSPPARLRLVHNLSQFTEITRQDMRFEQGEQRFDVQVKTRQQLP
jgi:hypothetical protein